MGLVLLGVFSRLLGQVAQHFERLDEVRHDHAVDKQGKNAACVCVVKVVFEIAEDGGADCHACVLQQRQPATH